MRQSDGRGPKLNGDTRSGRRFDRRPGCGIDLRDMNTNDGLALVAPRGHAGARPGLPAGGAGRARASRPWWPKRPEPFRCGSPWSRPTGQCSGSNVRVLPDTHPGAAANTRYLERFLKFLLWSRGGWRIYLDAPAALARRLGRALRRLPHRQVRRSPGRGTDVRSPARDRPARRICPRSSLKRSRSAAISKAAASGSISGAATGRSRR